MAELLEAFLQNGSVAYSNGDEAIARSEEKRGDVTYITEGSAGTPDSFEVTFAVISSFEVEGLSCRPYISITVPVAATTKEVSFRDVESRAAEEVAPILRSIADRVEEQLAAVRETWAAAKVVGSDQT